MKYYPSPQKIEELIKGGDLVDLEKTADKYTYCKDDAEKWGDTSPQSHKGLSFFFAKYMQKVDYLYIYRSGKWYCHDCKE